MPIIASDIKYYKSTKTVDGKASLGGAITVTEIVEATLNNLWDDVEGAEASSGDTEYRCIYVKNTHGSLTLQNAVLWITQLTVSPDDEIDIAKGSSGLGGTEQEIANESTPPTAVSFTRPVTKGTGIALGNITPGSWQAFWIKRIVNAAAAAYSLDNYILRVEGETIA